MQRGAGRQTIAALGMAVASLAAVLAVAATPAAASTAYTGYSQLVPVTWVDGQGRQYVLADEIFTVGEAPPTGFRLVVTRDLATGDPDTTWGPSGSNKRVITPTPPADGAVVHRVAAASASGVITLIWNSAGCKNAPDACGRWFHQIDATGATVAAPVFLSDLTTPMAGLPDGSVLIGQGTGPIAWRGPDGTNRTAPAVAAADVRSASVDADGRLIVAATYGEVFRHPVGGPTLPAVDIGCAAAGGIAVGGAPAAGGGFAVACGSIDQSISVTRYDESGTAEWTATDTVAPNSVSKLQVPTDLAITSDDRVWVAGRGELWDNPSFPIGGAVLASFEDGGPVTSEYTRATVRPGHYDVAGTGVSDLRTIDATHVAMADLQLCCETIAGLLPESDVTGQVFPTRPAPPNCNGPQPTVIAATSSTVDVQFITCPTGDPARAATGYRVVATTTEGPVTKTVTESGASQVVSTNLTGIAAGRLLSIVVVPFNANGDSVGNPSSPAKTVAPFRDIGPFANRPYKEGRCDLLGLSEGAAKSDLIRAGTLAPEDHVADILQRCEAEARIEPVARLYQAAFVRSTDTTGLRYWVSRSRNGTQLRSIASEFARSSEFTRRYGTLTNRKFVERIYQNVLGRPGDAGGIAFWTKRLDTGKESRGGVLAQFSESGEHIRRTDPLIQPTAAWFLMLDRAPNASERATIATFEKPRQDAVLTIMAMPAYATRVAA